MTKNCKFNYFRACIQLLVTPNMFQAQVLIFLLQLDEKVDESLKGEVDLMLKEVQNDNMKEVKGLEDRLYGLDQIISGARKIVQEQGDLAQVT